MLRPNSHSPARPHEVSHVGASTRSTAAVADRAVSRSAVQRTAQPTTFPRRINPLWAINAGLAAFLAIVALIMMMD